MMIGAQREHLRRLRDRGDWVQLTIAYVASGFELDKAISLAIEVVRSKVVDGERWSYVLRSLQILREDYTDRRLEDNGEPIPLEGEDVLKAINLVVEATLCEGAKVVDQELQTDGLILGLKAAEKFKIHSIECGYESLVAFADSIMGNALYELKDFGKAKESYQASFKIRRRLEEQFPGVYSSDIAMVLNNLGNTQTKLQEFSHARSNFNDALGIYRDLAREAPRYYLERVCNTLQNLGVAYSEMQQPGKAIPSLVEAVEISRQLAVADFVDDRSQLVVALTNLATSQNDSGDFLEAERAHEEAVELCEELLRDDGNDFRSLISTVFHNAASFYHEVGDLFRAKELSGECVALRRKLAGENPSGYELALAVSLSLLGDVNSDGNLVELAHQNFLESAALFSRVNGKLGGVFEASEANVLNCLGVCQYEMGYFRRALESLRRALVLFRENSRFALGVYEADIAMVCANLGNLLSDLKRTEEARDYYSESLEIRKQLVGAYPEIHLPKLASSYLSYGGFYREQGDFETAGICFRKGVKIRRELFAKAPSVYRDDLARSLNSLGVLDLEAGDLENAEGNFREALNLLQGDSGNAISSDLESLQIAWNNLGMVLLKRVDGEGAVVADEARDAFRKAVDYLERYRGALMDPYQRRRVHRESQGVYHNLVDACFRLWCERRDIDMIREIVDTSEGNRMRLVGDIFDDYPSLPVGCPRELADDFMELHEEVLELRRRLCFSLPLQRKGGASEAISNEAQQRFRFGVSSSEKYSESEKPADKRASELAQVVLRRSEIVEKMRAFDPSFDADYPVRKVSGAEVLKLVGNNPEVTLVQYLLSEERVFVVILAQGYSELVKLPECTGSELRELAEQWTKTYRKVSSEFRFGAGDGGPWPVELEEALASILEEINEKVVLPILDYLPDNRRLVICSHRSLHLVPLHACLLPNGEFLGDRFSVAYIPNLSVFKASLETNDKPNTRALFVGDPLENLPFAKLEAEELANYYRNSNTLSGQQVTKQGFLEKAVNAGCVHFAGHASFEPDNNLESSLHLCDSKLTLRDVFSELRLTGDCLVILNGCESGYLVPDTSDDYLSFPIGFLYSGASAVISSLWSVDDLPAFLVMRRFHRNYSSGKSASLALQEAVSWLRHGIQTGHQLCEDVVPSLIKEVECSLIAETLMESAEGFAKQFPDRPPFASPLYWGNYMLAGNGEKSFA